MSPPDWPLLIPPPLSPVRRPQNWGKSPPHFCPSGMAVIYSESVPGLSCCNHHGKNSTYFPKGSACSETTRCDAGEQDLIGQNVNHECDSGFPSGPAAFADSGRL